MTFEYDRSAPWGVRFYEHGETPAKHVAVDFGSEPQLLWFSGIGNGQVAIMDHRSHSTQHQKDQGGTMSHEEPVSASRRSETKPVTMQEMQENKKDLAYYKSHKSVHAGKITGLFHSSQKLGDVFVMIGGTGYVMTTDGRPMPEVGWYLVVYENGYYSFSPAKTFESGYVLIEEEPKTFAVPPYAMGPSKGLTATEAVAEAANLRFTPVGRTARMMTWVEKAGEKALSAFMKNPSPGIGIDAVAVQPISYGGPTGSKIIFNLQTTPVREGVQGCQIDHVIMFAKEALIELNGEVPCRESSVAITKLDEALMWLQKRREDRIQRGVEGTRKA